MSTRAASELPDVEVSHVTSKDDFTALATVESQAFSGSASWAQMFPPGTLAVAVKNHQTACTSDPNVRYLKACLPDGTIVGMAKWYLFLDAASAGRDPWDIEFAPDANVELARWFFGGLNLAREKGLAGKRHMLLALLAVSPAHQRMGIGHKLLRWGLEKADEEKVDCWIDASQAGFGLYKKFGWEEAGKFEVDVERWVGEKSDSKTLVHMIRPPKAQ